MDATTFKGRAGISSIRFSHSVETEKCFCWSSLTYGVGASPGAPRPVSIGQTFQHPCSIVNSSLEAAVAFNPRVNHCRPESRRHCSTSTGGLVYRGVTKNFCAKVVRRVIRLSYAGSERTQTQLAALVCRDPKAGARSPSWGRTRSRLV